MIPDLFIPNPDAADRLEEGFYLLTMHRAGRVSVPIRIWYGPPVDEDGRPMERSWRWQIEINGVLFGDPENPACIAGRPIDSIEEFWPVCKAQPIDETEYRYRVARAEWAEQHDDNDPFAGTGRKVDPMTATLPFS